MNFTPFPVLETDRLILRQMSNSDADDIFAMRQDPSMHEHTDTKPDTALGESRAYIEKMNQGVADNKWIIWAMEHKGSGKVIGTISIWNINQEEMRGELGFGIVPAYQGKGLMTEALSEVTKYGLEKLALKKLDAYTEENNLPSIGLLKKCGFAEVSRVTDVGYTKQRDYNMVVFSLSNMD